MPGNTFSKGVWLSLAGSAVLGGLLVIFTLGDSQVMEETASVVSIDSPAPTVEYGQRLLRETTNYLGIGQEDPDKRYIGNSLDCASCHLETGMQPGTLSLLQAASKYPRFSGRDGGDRDLRDRINGCMQRSMNGRPLPRDSVEMIAMEGYILSLGRQHDAMPQSKLLSMEPPAFAEPDRKADLVAGEAVYVENCQVCHGENGAGLKESLDPGDGYVFPPLWGEESYNNGAGMNRVLTAARFIKARMPLGQPDLTDDEAYDVSAYINSKPRPIKSELEQDYPELFRKPVDSPYPPYADPFPQEQHKYGPFEPIRAYYEQQANNGA